MRPKTAAMAIFKTFSGPTGFSLTRALEFISIVDFPMSADSATRVSS